MCFVKEFNDLCETVGPSLYVMYMYYYRVRVSAIAL